MKEKLQELIKNPVFTLSATYPYILVVLVAIGFFYINNNNSMILNKVNPKLPDTSKVVDDLTLQLPKVSVAVDIKMIQMPTQQVLEKGNQLYTNTCASCHGTGGKGDGIAGASLNPKPRNFALNEGWKNGTKFSQIYLTLQKGISGSGMSAYDFLPVEDRIAIIHFVRTLMTSPPELTNSEISDLDKSYGLTTGIKIAGTMPLENAEKFIQKTYEANSEKCLKLLTKLSELESTEAGVKLFTEITSDQKKALTTLINSNNWQSSISRFLFVTQSNLITNGFNGKINSLTNDELETLHSFLKGIFI